MKKALNRRDFVRKSVLAASTTAAVLSLEEQALLAFQGQPAAESPADKPRGDFPKGKIGKLSVSRLICGGNLISGFAHSRDLIYVSTLLRHYFTDAKVHDTLQLCESHGINTAILRLDENMLRILKGYRKERGGRIQWIAQVKITEKDVTSEAQKAIDNGAVAAYVHGGVGDDFVQRGRVDLLRKALDHIKQNGVVAGIAGHSLAVPVACEKAGLNPDFYMKTFNSKNYWSAKLPEEHDNVWEDKPQDTLAFMQELDKPWIAYKVLAAGAIHPREGFQYAFQHGADFICAGMFDFQVAEDVSLALAALEKNRLRNRPWCG
jgi:hypothetical protein